RMAELAAHAADEKSASNIAVIDVSDVLAITELFVIASADNERQVRSIVEEVEDALTAEGFEPKRREGVRENRWVLLDYGFTIVHFKPKKDAESSGLALPTQTARLFEMKAMNPPRRPVTWNIIRVAK